MVLVMDAGLAAEWGRPAALLDNPQGVFTSMVQETGHGAEQFLRSVAYGQLDHKTERDQRAAAALQKVQTSTPDWQADTRYVPLGGGRRGRAGGGGDGAGRTSLEGHCHAEHAELCLCV